jgi:hypothetical protein
MFHSRLKVFLLTTVAAIAVAGCNNHFTLYRVDSTAVNFQTLVTGQLDPAPKQVHLLKLTHFANPAEKQHGGTVAEIYDKNAHLNWYDITQTAAEPLRTVRFKNQFGQHSVRIQAPKSLLVPAQKTSDPTSAFPSSLDHYKCYEGVNVPTAPTLPVVTLTDQFVTDISLQVGPPRYFCVPVSKQIPGAPPEPIKNEKNHLAVYELPPKDKLVEITTEDQFGDKELKVKRLVFLAVPTEKQVVVPAPP